MPTLAATRSKAARRRSTPTGFARLPEARWLLVLPSSSSDGAFFFPGRRRPRADRLVQRIGIKSLTADRLSGTSSPWSNNSWACRPNFGRQFAGRALLDGSKKRRRSSLSEELHVTF